MEGFHDTAQTDIHTLNIYPCRCKTIKVGYESPSLLGRLMGENTNK